MKWWYYACVTAVFGAGGAYAQEVTEKKGPASAPKTLSASEVRDYLEGAEMGLGKVAELNLFPDARRILQLADALALNETQRREAEAIQRESAAEAARLGAEIVAKESELDLAFSRRKIDATRLRQFVEEIAALQARLRFTHLKARLRVNDLLTFEQIATYDRYRGTGDRAGRRGHGQGSRYGR